MKIFKVIAFGFFLCVGSSLLSLIELEASQVDNDPVLWAYRIIKQFEAANSNDIDVLYLNNHFLQPVLRYKDLELIGYQAAWFALIKIGLINFNNDSIHTAN